MNLRLPSIQFAAMLSILPLVFSAFLKITSEKLVKRMGVSVFTLNVFHSRQFID